MDNPRIIFDPQSASEYLYTRDANDQPVRQRIWRDPFWYTFPVFSNIAAAGTQVQSIVIQSDADFEWTHSAYQYSLANAAFTDSTRPVPNSSVQVVDLGSGRQLTNAAAPLEALFGTYADDPFKLPLSKVFSRNATIGITVTNFDAAVATGQLRLTMLGYKIFYY